MEKPKPAYWKPIIHNCRRRATWHDYCSRRIYMLTVSKHANSPDFGILRGTSPSEASIELTPSGVIISEEIDKTAQLRPQIDIISTVIMPDHFHVIIFVKEELEKPVGNAVQAIKAAATRRINALAGRDARSAIPIFTSGYHDRIITSRGQLSALKNYLRENPQRLFIKRENPDLFRRYSRLGVGNDDFAAFGNIFLLRNFHKMQVVIHRADTPEIRSSNEKRWLDCAINGGALISPFISPAEKAIRDKAIEAGGNIIIVRRDGFEERFKPTGREFALCAEGRLLLIAPWPDHLNDAIVTRREALAMNALAGRLAAISPATPIFLKRRGR